LCIVKLKIAWPRPVGPESWPTCAPVPVVSPPSPARGSFGRVSRCSVITRPRREPTSSAPAGGED